MAIKLNGAASIIYTNNKILNIPFVIIKFVVYLLCKTNNMKSISS